MGGGWLYAAIANRMISAGLVGAVYGGDAEDVLMRVTRLPPLLGKTRELCIEALQIGGIDDKAIFASAQKVYEEALANEKSEGGLSDPDRLWKLLSDALYHTPICAIPASSPPWPSTLHRACAPWATSADDATSRPLVFDTPQPTSMMSHNVYARGELL